MSQPLSRRYPSALVLALLSATISVTACNQATTTTSPSPIATSTTSAVTETVSGTLPVGGSRFYSFSLAAAGTVTATLVSVGGQDVPDSVVVNLGIGTPSGTTCSASQTAVQVTGGAGLTTVVSASEQPGIYCVLIADAGNLFAPAAFTVSIDHP